MHSQLFVDDGNTIAFQKVSPKTTAIYRFFFFSIFLWMEDLIEFEKRIENHCNVHYSSSVTRSQFDNRNYHLLLFPRRIRLEDTQPIRQTFFSVYRIVQVSSSRTQTQI